MNELEQKIRERIAHLKQERDQLLVEANQRVAAYSAAIAELERLIAAEPKSG